MAVAKTLQAILLGSPVDPEHEVVATELLAKLQAMEAATAAAAAGVNRLADCAQATTANITLSGEQTIDGTLTSATRILVKNQTTGSQNGVYVTAAGSWARATDADASAEIANAFIYVTTGTVNAGTAWAVSGSPVLGTDAVVFAQIGVGGIIPADTDDLAQGATNLYATTANVTTVGALMDSEVASLSGIKTLTVPDSTTITAAGAALVAGADAAAMRTTLEIENIIDAANDAIVLGDETRLEHSDEYALIVKDEAGNVLLSVDYDGDLQGFGDLESAALVAPEQTKTTSLSWYPADTLIIAPVGGQSNADGVNADAGDALISSTAVYPTRALTVLGGPRITAETGADLVALVENTDTSGRRESLCSGFANNLIAAIDAVFGIQPYVATFVAAQTALKLTDLNRGSDKYNLILAGVRDCTAYALRQSLVPICPGWSWVQGEAEANKVTSQTYFRGLQRLARNMAADIKAITGQADDPIMFITQVATGNRRALSAANWFPDGPGLAANMADPLIRLAGPMYQFPISSDDLHLSCQGQNRHGAQLAQAWIGEFAKTGWHGIRYVGGRWTSTTVLRLEFDVPDNGDLAIVTDGEVTDTVDSVHGFQAVGPTGAALTISSATVPASVDASNIAARFVDLTFSAPVTGPVRVAYAILGEGASGNGPVTGPRGCLASDATYTPLSGGAIRYWCPAFIADTAGL